MIEILSWKLKTATNNIKQFIFSGTIGLNYTKIYSIVQKGFKYLGVRIYLVSKYFVHLHTVGVVAKFYTIN